MSNKTLPHSTLGIENLDADGRDTVKAHIHAIENDADDLSRTLGAINLDIVYEMQAKADDDDLSPVVGGLRRKLDEYIRQAQEQLDSLERASLSLAEYHDDWPKC